MSCCFQSPRQWCRCFRPSLLRFLVIFFHPTDRPTQNQETYSTLNERKGDDLSLMVSFWASSPHCFCVFLYTCLLLCFVLFVGKINWNCTKTINIPFGGSRTRMKKKWKTRWFIDRKGNGVARARYCAPVHSCAVKWSRYTKWKMTADRLFTSKHQASFKMGLMSPLPVHGVDSRCWRQFRDALHIAETCFKRAFLQLWSPPSSPCQPCEKWCTSQKQSEVIFDFPRPLSPKVADRTASKYSPPPGQNGWTCSCGCAGDSNRSN